MSISPQLARTLLSEIAETRRLFMAAETAIGHGVVSPCITVTSAGQGEGKTLLSVALASESARHLEKPALLMDLNWYRPALHNYFDVRREATVGALAESEAVHKYKRPSGVPRLDVLPAPLPYEPSANPPPISEVLPGLLRDARAAYGMVWLDCPAIFPTNRWMVDPLAVARRSDLVLLVVLSAATPRQDAKRARMTLETAGARNLSIVLNQWNNPLD